LLTESLLLGLVGAAVGVIMALAAGDALASLLPESVSGGFRFQHGVNGHVLAFTLVLAMIAMLVSGLTPAVRASEFDLASAGKAYTASGARTPRLRQWLVVAQVAASALMLATAGVFLRSFKRRKLPTQATEWQICSWWNSTCGSPGARASRARSSDNFGAEWANCPAWYRCHSRTCCL
jgi:hypothetical protein